MKTFPNVLALTFFMLLSGMLSAQNSIINKSHRIHLENSRKTFSLHEIKIPGTLEVTANFRGTARSLALMVNGPGKVGFYARKDGRSPVKLTFEITSEHLKKGSGWKLTVVNFSKNTSATGTVRINFTPKPRRGVIDKSRYAPRPEKSKKTTTKRKGSTTRPPQNNQPEPKTTTILSDGTIRVTQTDGSYTDYHPNGSQTRYDAKTDTKIGQTLVQIQRASPPKPLESLTNNRNNDIQLMNDWLKGLDKDLIAQIELLLYSDKAAIQQYNNLENSKKLGLYERVDFRYEFLKRLRRAKR